MQETKATAIRTNSLGLAKSPENKVEAAIRLPLSPLPEHAIHWTVRALASALEMVQSAVRNILLRKDLGTLRVKTSMASRNSAFKEMTCYVVGLYAARSHADPCAIELRRSLSAVDWAN